MKDKTGEMERIHENIKRQLGLLEKKRICRAELQSVLVTALSWDIRSHHFGTPRRRECQNGDLLCDDTIQRVQRQQRGSGVGDDTDTAGIASSDGQSCG